MELSERLKTVANLVRYSTMADIGTDHGYVPIYLYKQRRLKKALACDINSGPLEKARQNIQCANAQGVISCRLGSGLSPVKPYEVESAVIAGMGGMLILQILKNSLDVAHSMKELILSPHSDVARVRHSLHELGFCIEEEWILQEDGKYYPILRVVSGTQKFSREIDYLFGKSLLEKQDPILAKMLSEENKKRQKVQQQLLQVNTKHTRERLQEIRKEEMWIKEALKCL